MVGAHSISTERYRTASLTEGISGPIGGEASFCRSPSVRPLPCPPVFEVAETGARAHGSNARGARQARGAPRATGGGEPLLSAAELPPPPPAASRGELRELPALAELRDSAGPFGAGLAAVCRLALRLPVAVPGAVPGAHRPEAAVPQPIAPDEDSGACAPDVLGVVLAVRAALQARTP